MELFLGNRYVGSKNTKMPVMPQEALFVSTVDATRGAEHRKGGRKA